MRANIDGESSKASTAEAKFESTVLAVLLSPAETPFRFSSIAFSLFWNSSNPGSEKLNWGRASAISTSANKEARRPTNYQNKLENQ